MQKFLITLLCLASPAFAYETAFPTWSTNKPVKAMASQDSTVYLGGEFYQIGPYNGGGMLVDSLSGAVLTPTPLVDGWVQCVLADGSGGWYVGGNFSQVNGLNRVCLAHLLPNMSTDPAFIANLNSTAQVYGLHLEGNTLFIAGFISTVNGTARNGLAAVNKNSGSLVPGFNANLDNSVWTMAFSGSTLILGGPFTQVLGQTRNYIAEVLTETASTYVTPYNPSADDRVHSLLVSGNTLFVGGRFKNIGGQPRNYVAALDYSGSTGWAKAGFDAGATTSTATFQVRALALSATTLVVGGNFENMGGQNRPYLAALNSSTGAALPWDPGTDNWIYGLTLSAGTIYASGAFRIIGGQVRNHFAGLDLSSNTSNAWDPNAGATSWTVAAAPGSALFVGGEQRSLGGVKRENLAAINANTGQPTAFDPGLLVGPTNSYVNALAVSGSTLYAGGNFTEVSGVTRNYLAAFDANSGALAAFNPSADQPVLALAVTGTTLYAGGDFLNIGGQSRSRIAGLNTGTGLATGFNPGANGQVQALAVNNGLVYTGGSFTNISGQARNYLAALDGVNGGALAFDPSPDAAVISLLAAPTGLYVGGSFVNIGGLVRQRIALLNFNSGATQSFNASTVDGNVNALTFFGNLLYIGGTFNQAGSKTRFYIAALDKNSGSASFFSSSTNGIINSLANVGAKIFAGGTFTRAFGLRQQNFASTIDSPATPTPTVEIATPGNIEAYPLPAKTQICFAANVQGPGELVIDVFNTAMQPVATFKNTLAGSGQQSVCENLGPIVSGGYIYRARFGGHIFPLKKFWVAR